MSVTDEKHKGHSNFQPRSVDRIIDEINYQVRPEIMSKEEARDYLQAIVDDLEGSIDALNEEIGEGEEEETETPPETPTETSPEGQPPAA